MKRTASFVAVFLALGLPLTILAENNPVVNLGSPSWSYSMAHGLNNSGNVVGEYEPTNFFFVSAFVNRQGTTTDLGNLPGSPYAIAYAINDTNQIVGESNSQGDTHAFFYQNGNMSDLGTLTPAGGSGYSSARAINRAGQTVGESSLVLPSTIHAALFYGGTIKDLGALGGNYSAAYGVNNSGVIVGESEIVAQGITNVHAFVYTNNAGGSMLDLGTLGGNYSSARGINDSGTIVGESETVMGGITMLHAFSHRNGVMIDLGTLGGNTSSASAINSAGLIVGYATDPNEVANAFVYDGSKMINLTALLPANSGWTNLTSADGINDVGQIIGSGYRANGEFQAYLLTLSSPLTVALINPEFEANQFSFSFPTQTGHTYEAQFATPLGGTNNWITFTNVAGNGTVMRASDATGTNLQRYYRVVVH